MIFYRSFFEAIKELPLDVQGSIYNAIFSYGLDFTEVELTGISKTIWTLIKPQIDANIKRFENGKKPKTKQKESKTEAKDKQEISKTEANNNVNVNENENIPPFHLFLAYAIEKKPNVDHEAVRLKFDSWNETNWIDGNGKKIKNWKSKLLNTLPYLKESAKNESMDMFEQRGLIESIKRQMNYPNK